MTTSTMKLILASALLLTVTACGDAAETTGHEANNTTATNNNTTATNDTTGATNDTTGGTNTTGATNNTTGEAPAWVAGLQFMREEEKVAHDVYATFYELHGTQIFTNIQRAEATHTESVRQLLVTHHIEDPAEATPVGVFTSPDLQEIYDKLVAQGRPSAVEALKVGAYIEEHDIMDLDERLQQEGLPQDVADVYANLRMGSTYHLQSFVKNLESKGESYSPQLLSVEDYEAAMGTR